MIGTHNHEPNLQFGVLAHPWIYHDEVYDGITEIPRDAEKGSSMLQVRKMLAGDIV